MLPFKKHKRTRYSTINNYAEIINNYKELKKTLMFKKKGENPSHFLVPQKRSCSCLTSSDEVRVFPSHRHHQVGSIENQKELHRKRAFSSVPIRLLPATEKEETCNHGLRRSSGNGHNTLDLYEDNYHQNAQKETPKRKWCLNSASSWSKITRRMVNKTTQDSDFSHPSTTNFERTFLTSARRKSSHISSATQLNERTSQKWANVEASRVVSGLFQQEITIKTSVSGKVISLFNLDARQTETYQNIVYSSNEKGTSQYKFKEENVGLQYLSKKYPMMEPFTLNKCYGLCHCNVRKTETMLQDVLAGKEVCPPTDCSCTLSKKRRLCKKFSKSMI